jgi:hypothetical protein
MNDNERLLALAARLSDMLNEAQLMCYTLILDRNDLRARNRKLVDLVRDVAPILDNFSHTGYAQRCRAAIEENADGK